MLIGGVSVTTTTAPVIVTADPNGVVGSGLGSFAFDTTTQTFYINSDGGTTWRALALLGGSSRVPWQPGRYYFTPNASASAAVSNHGNNSLRLYPVYVSSLAPITRIGTQIVAPGDPGSVVRLGVYADDGTMRPGALVVDAGTIAADVAAVDELTISMPPVPGWYWFGGAVQNAAGGQPTVFVSRNVESPADAGNTMPIAAFESYGFRMSGVTGALPAIFVVTAPTASVIRTFVGVGI